MSENRERYEILAPGAEGNESSLYVIRDTRTGKPLVDGRGTLLAFPTRSSAVEWRHRLSCYEDAGYGRI